MGQHQSVYQIRLLKGREIIDKMKDAILFKNIEHKYLTLKDCIEENGGKVIEPNDKKDENQDQNKVEEIKTNNLLYHRRDPAEPVY